MKKLQIYLVLVLIFILNSCAEHTETATLYCPDGRTIKHIDIKECK